MAGGVLIYTHVGGYGFKIRCARAIFSIGFWCVVAQVTARAKRRVVCGRTGGGCEFGSLPRVAYFPSFVVACIAVFNARRLLGSKTWILATSHRQGPRMVPEARNASFGITGARNRPIPTLLPSETCTQTPLNRPRMLFRHDPDFADAPETAHNDGFRRHFAAARFFANFSMSSCGP